MASHLPGALDYDNPGQAEATVNGLHFSSKFDSGNANRFEYDEDACEYMIWSANDCEGTPHQTTFTTWFYFSVTGSVPGESITINIMNVNYQQYLYRNGGYRSMNMSVVKKSGGGVLKKKWERVKGFTINPIGGGQARLRWKFDFDPTGSSEKAFFAFCYPYPMTQVDEKITSYQKLYGLPSDLSSNQSPDQVDEENKDGGNNVLPQSPLKKKNEGDSHEALAAENPQRIYFYRETLCHSLGGLAMELLTITSHEGLLPEEREEHLPNLFPNRSQKRPHKFHSSKKVVFVSSRVHPGETPAQFVFDGFMDFILRPDDPRAVMLRKHYIFKLVPILNPDGVYRGHYRLDTLGQNLNRHYVEPDFETQPTIYASKAVVLDYCKKGIMYFYLDLHAHASKKGCFIYGNQLESLDDQVTNKLYPFLVAMNSQFFEYNACNFTEKNMKMKDKLDRGGASKEGSGRVAIYRQTGLLHSYVLECNYNKGKETSFVPAASHDNGRASPGTVKGTRPTVPIYVSEDWVDVGKGCAIAILDMNGINPWTRLVRSPWNNLDGAKQYVKRDVRSQPAYREESLQQRRSSHLLAASKRGNSRRVSKEAPIENVVVSISGRPPQKEQQQKEIRKIQEQIHDGDGDTQEENSPRSLGKHDQPLPQPHGLLSIPSSASTNDNGGASVAKSPNHGLPVGSDSEDDKDIEDEDPSCLRSESNRDGDVKVVSAENEKVPISRQLFEVDNGCVQESAVKRSTSSGNIAPESRGVAGLVRQRRGKDASRNVQGAVSVPTVSMTAPIKNAPVARATPRSLGMVPGVSQAYAAEGSTTEGASASLPSKAPSFTTGILNGGTLCLEDTTSSDLKACGDSKVKELLSSVTVSKPINAIPASQRKYAKHHRSISGQTKSSFKSKIPLPASNPKTLARVE